MLSCELITQQYSAREEAATAEKGPLKKANKFLTISATPTPYNIIFDKEHGEGEAAMKDNLEAKGKRYVMRASNPAYK